MQAQSFQGPRVQGRWHRWTHLTGDGRRRPASQCINLQWVIELSGRPDVRFILTDTFSPCRQATWEVKQSEGCLGNGPSEQEHRVWLLQCPAAWCRAPLNQSGHWVQRRGPLPRSVLSWVVQSSACITLLTVLPVWTYFLYLGFSPSMPAVCLIRVLLILARHERDLSHWWGFVLLGCDCAVLIACWILRGKAEAKVLEGHPCADSVYSTKTPPPTHTRGSVLGPFHSLFLYDHRLCSTSNVFCANFPSSMSSERQQLSCPSPRLVLRVRWQTQQSIVEAVQTEGMLTFSAAVPRLTVLISKVSLEPQVDVGSHTKASSPTNASPHSCSAPCALVNLPTQSRWAETYLRFC